MNDKFELRENSTVAWLSIKRTISEFVTPSNEELLKLIFMLGFSSGWGKGLDAAKEMVVAIGVKHDESNPA